MSKQMETKTNMDLKGFWGNNDSDTGTNDQGFEWTQILLWC
jgi:hypothetical protein